MKTNKKSCQDNHTDGRGPTILHREDWASHDSLWKGCFQGENIGTDITVLFYATDKLGEGPLWHVHPYDEIFIIRSGKALFTIGDNKVEAQAGDILLGPANIPHKYHNIGDEVLETTDLHLSSRWIQTNLEDPEIHEA